MNNLSIGRLLSPDNVAKILGVSMGTLTVWRSTGRVNLPFVKVGRKVMYKPEEIQNFIDRRSMAHIA